ncbi:hypothetical protein [Paenibacillus sanfengchensis]|uniref:hypothetical protein n=1 Tax=Paenibacillus sanfengchensis TaxID=3119819 RepID=UPI002FDF8D9D
MENHEIDKAREVKELRSRLDAVEQQLAQKPKIQLPGAVKFGIALIAGLFLPFLLVGVFLFISEW